MSEKATTTVTIGGKAYSLSGFEQEDYLKEVAAYIDEKISDVNSFSGINRLTVDLQVLMTEINIANDYFKAKTEAREAGSRVDALSKELYELKQRLVDLEMKEKKEENKNEKKDHKSREGRNDGINAMIRNQNESLAKDIEEKDKLIKKLEEESAKKDKYIKELEHDKKRLTSDLEELLLDDPNSNRKS